MAQNKQADENPLEQIARCVDLLLRLKIDEVKGDRTQGEMIRFLGSQGATPAEVASLLGVKPSTVYPELSKARASKGKQDKAGPRAPRKA